MASIHFSHGYNSGEEKNGMDEPLKFEWKRNRPGWTVPITSPALPSGCLRRGSRVYPDADFSFSRERIDAALETRPRILSAGIRYEIRKNSVGGEESVLDG